MRKLNTTVDKALFSKLLKQVRDEVLQPSIIVKAFSTCGYTPLNFAASYAYTQVPPPAAAPVETESRPSSPSPSDSSHSSSESSPISSSPPLHMTDPLTPKCHLQHTPLYLLSPKLRPSGKPNPLGAIRTRLQALVGNATPRRLAKVRNEVLHKARRAAVRDYQMSMLVEVINLHTEVIEVLDTCHILDDQYAGHLKTQLANHTRPKVRGNVLKHGFGAMDTAALELLLQEQEDKEAEEEEVQRIKEAKKDERERKKLDDAEAKAEKAREKAQARALKAAADAEIKIKKAEKREAAKLEKARVAAEKASGVRGKARGRLLRGKGVGRGQGTRKTLTPKPFPMILSGEGVLEGDGDDLEQPSAPVARGRGRGRGQSRGRGVVPVPGLAVVLEESSGSETTSKDGSDGTDSTDSDSNDSDNSSSSNEGSMARDNNTSANLEPPTISLQNAPIIPSIPATIVAPVIPEYAGVRTRSRSTRSARN